MLVFLDGKDRSLLEFFYGRAKCQEFWFDSCTDVDCLRMTAQIIAFLPLIFASNNVCTLQANSITAFAEVFARIEQAKMEMHRDLERQRTEADLKRTQMVLNNQLEIAKLVARSRKRKSRSAPSSSESEWGYASLLTYLNVMFQVV